MGFVGDEIDEFHAGPAPRPVVRLSVIGEAWGLFTREMGVWIGAVFVAGLCNAAVNSVVGVPSGREIGFKVVLGGGFPVGGNRAAGVARTVVSALTNGFFLGGMVRMACKQVRGQRIAIGDLFSVFDCLPQLALASVLISLATLAGFSCLVLPGFVVAGLLLLTLPLVVDGRRGALEAMRGSWKALQGQWLEATVVHVVLAIVAGSGALLCCVGLLFTAPLYGLGVAVLYRDFLGGKGMAAV